MVGVRRRGQLLRSSRPPRKQRRRVLTVNCMIDLICEVEVQEEEEKGQSNYRRRRFYSSRWERTDRIAHYDRRGEIQRGDTVYITATGQRLKEGMESAEETESQSEEG